MSNAKLLSLTIERFKSFENSTKIDFAPLTIILGRNNSGKSSIIQALLLLKQTLNHPRTDVLLHLEGLVDAFNLRELTFGWPAPSDHIEGPSISLEWESTVDMETAIEKAFRPDLWSVASKSSVTWLEQPKPVEVLRSKIVLKTGETFGNTGIREIQLWSARLSGHGEIDETDLEGAPLLRVVESDGTWKCYWRGEVAQKLQVQLEHFIPLLLINRRDIGPRHRERSWHNAYLMLFEQPLADLAQVLSDLQFLGSSRQPPPSIYKASTAPLNEVGATGELAAQLLHRRQRDLVHFLPALEFSATGNLQGPGHVRVRTLAEAVNEAMQGLSINAPVSIEEIRDIGFRLMFGDASLAHVGRGLNSLLPLVELGLFADPLRFTGSVGDISLEEYEFACGAFSHIAFEEPEAHLHPKVASRLAHWFVSLAMSRRRLLVETHSDHLVRRIRGLVARAGRGSSLEAWLLRNVAIVAVEQHEGRSHIVTSYLTPEGGVAQNWPADFMDEATDEESAIYYAKLDKDAEDSPEQVSIAFDDSEEPEVNTEP